MPVPHTLGPFHRSGSTVRATFDGIGVPETTYPAANAAPYDLEKWIPDAGQYCRAGQLGQQSRQTVGHVFARPGKPAQCHTYDMQLVREYRSDAGLPLR